MLYGATSTRAANHPDRAVLAASTARSGLSTARRKGPHMLPCALRTILRTVPYSTCEALAGRADFIITFPSLHFFKQHH